MTISQLQITNFRNIASLSLSPQTRGLNVIYGLNGSGKSSFLEAIHYIGHGRSFRTAKAAHLVKHHLDKFCLFAQIELHESQRLISAGLEKSLVGALRIRLDGTETTNFTELASLLPIRVINAQSHQLFESGPQFRRKYIDWGLFYQNAQFLLCWRQFERALKQRNALLSTRKTAELASWTATLAHYGEELDQYRRQYVEEITPHLSDLVNQLLPLENFTIQYQSGWDKAYAYRDILLKSQAEDLAIGYTQYGPQRGDLMITSGGIQVKHFLSRGQQKLLICAMILAQGLLLIKTVNKRLIYLVDDLPSELDLRSRERLISLLINQETQIFITAIERHMICDLISDSCRLPMNVFHVEQGSVFSM